MSGLEARIAEVLADHAMRHQGQCVCGWRLIYGPHKLLKTEHEAAREHVASMLAPVIAEQLKADREAQAANLRRIMSNRYSSFDETYSIPGRDLQNHVLVLEGREPFTDEDEDDE